MSNIGTLDWIVIAAYFGAVVTIAVWAIRKERSGEETSADYFLAGRNIGWFVVGASLLPRRLMPSAVAGRLGFHSHSRHCGNF